MREWKDCILAAGGQKDPYGLEMVDIYYSATYLTIKSKDGQRKLGSLANIDILQITPMVTPETTLANL